MKKSLIAGAGVAALAMAALPFTGVFAATSVTDNLTLTVTSQCQLGDITPAAAESSANEYLAEGAPGETVDFNAQQVSGATAAATTIEINCNNANGYKITPQFSVLHLQGTEATTQDIAYGGAATPADKTWTAFYKKGTAAVAPFTASGTAINGDPTMTDTYTFSYKVHIGTNQAAGTYKGTAQYTVAPAS